MLLYCFCDWFKQGTTIANAIVDRYSARYEGMKIVHRQIEHCLPAFWSSFYYLECECRQCACLLLYAVALCSFCVHARVQRREPLTHTDLAEQFNRRWEVTTISM